VTVKLLEAGAEPRAALRLRAAKGVREQAKMTMSMKTTAGGEEAAAQKIGIELSTEVKEVLENGDRQIEMVLGTMTLDMGAAAAGMKDVIDRMLASTKGTRVSARMTERGRQTDVKVTMPDDVDPVVSHALEQSMEQMGDLGVRFLPEEAVGVGARWEIKDQPEEDGMKLDQTVLFRLKSREKERLVLEMEIVQSALPQTIENDELPGVEMELVSLTSKGAGTIVYDLGRLIPIQATLTLDMAMEMRIGGGPGVEGETMKMDMAMEVGMTGELAPATTPAKPETK
jgi:hypothetical protein